ncbi:MAG: hypothetical protein V4438_01480 [Patescibacteria group bacterium]
MLALNFSYFYWHYTEALKELIQICRNFLWFVYHFFSMDVLSKTLLSPWQRLDEPYKKGSGIEGFFETFVVNTLMRILGFFIRSFVILMGAIVWLFVLMLEIAAFALWLVLPCVIIILFISGLRLLIK